MNKELLHELIGDVCDRRAHGEAIREPGSSISYEALRQWYEQISGSLQACGLHAGEAVGVYLESGIDYVSTILGINLSGVVFMPLEVQYPQKRLEHILEVVRPRVIVTRAGLRTELMEKLSGMSCDWLEQMVYLNRSDLQISREVLKQDGATEQAAAIETIEPVAGTGVKVKGDDSNYLLYTSGSTGVPKVIEGRHRSLSHFIHWEVAEFNLGQEVRVGQLVPLSFDVSLRDIYVPLLSGGVLVVPDRATRQDGRLLVDWIRRESITLLHTVPSVLRLLMREMGSGGLPSLRLVILAGEALYWRDVLQWRELTGTSSELVNIYGPTETTLAKIFYRVGAQVGEPHNMLPLGKPISNTSILIINNRVQCKTGAIGEIHIRTPFMTKGYYRDAALTSEKFIQNPLHNDYIDIVYKTGDYGRYLADGNISFAGRQDGQVKIRGNRVEVAEVESTLLGLTGIGQVVVLAHRLQASRENEVGEEVLCCYYTGQVQDNGVVRSYLADRLPEYMHPSYYLQLEELPLALNGKVDKRSLPAPQELLEAQFPYEAPQTALEELLCTMWAELLGLRRVGVATSFFELGGHSLTATRAVSRIYKETGIEINLKDFFDRPRIRQLAAYLEGQQPGAYQPVLRVADQLDYPVSPGQKLLWILDQSSGGMIAYNMPVYCLFGAGLDKTALSWSLQQLVNRHESLRTHIVVVAGEPRQRIKEELVLELQQIDGSAEPEEELIARSIQDAFGDPFDLQQGPLLRARLVKLRSGRYLFMCTMHHIISDGWSLGVLMKDILVYYESYRKGEQAELPPLRIQYRDYVMWQQQQQQGLRAEEDRLYWQRQLGGERPVLQLPLDYPRPVRRSYQGAKQCFRLSADMSEAVMQVCRREESGLFIFFLTVIKVLLYGYSGQEDIMVGSPISGRNQQELEDQIGFYLNNLVLRSRIRGQEGFTALLRRVKQTTLEAYAHQSYPFYQMVEELGGGATEDRNAYYDVLVVMNNAELNGSRVDNDRLWKLLQIEEVEVKEEISKLDLTFFISEEPQIGITIEYGTDLFKAATIEKMQHDMQQLIGVVLAHPNRPIDELLWMYASEVDSALLQKNKNIDINTEEENGLLHELIGDVCDRRAHGEAIREPGSSISYEALRQWYEQISGSLQACGLHAGEAVGVYLESGIDYVSTILGINLSGVVFMPLEVQYPQKRLEHILEVVRPRVIVTRAGLRTELMEKLSGMSCDWLEQMVYLNRSDLQISREVLKQDGATEQAAAIETIEPVAGTGVKVKGDDSNYLLYTSGSTGVPKVIEGRHRSLSHFIHWEVAEFNLGQEVRVGQLVPLSFDVSLRDIYVPLLSGGVLVVPDRATRQDGRLLVDWIRRESITLLHTVPSVLRLLMREMGSGGLPSLRLVILAGEALYWRDVLQWRELTGTSSELVNIYGPTETTLAKIFYRVGAQVGEPHNMLPLGKPISNTSILIINNRVQCKTGAIGEIHIRTPFMTKGYYRDAALTSEKFIQNPLHNDYIDIVYKTGDYGRYLADGNISFAGRQDGQVKIRGNRVEVAEVESTLLGLTGIGQVVVLAHRLQASRENEVGEEVLCCYYTGQVQDNGVVRSYLADRLPEYMHPSYYLQLEELPLALNGKVDKRSLPAPQELLEAQFPYEAPQTALEELLCTMWAELLGLRRVGVATSFFELGGHSLTATRAVSRIYKETGIEINLKDFFDRPRIRQLAAYLEGQQPGAYQPVLRVADQLDYPVSPGQKLLWILDQSSGGMIAYNMPVYCLFGAGLDKTALSWSLQQLVNRHESLRTHIVVVAGEPRQRIKEELVLELQQIDGSAEPEEELIARSIQDAFGDPFDLQQGPLLRARLVKLRSGRYLFMCTMHHIISDGWSLGVLMKDILVYYESYRKGEQAELPPLRIQYRDYVMWQQQQQQGLRAEEDRLYWQRQLGGERPVLQLPLDYPRPVRRTFIGEKLYLRINKKESNALRSLSKEEDASLFMTFFALVKVLVYQLSGQSDIILGSALTGRNHIELEDQIGFFVNLFVIQSKLDRKETFREYLSRIRKLVLEAYEHQVPFEQLLEDLGIESGTDRNPLFDVLVVLNNEGLLQKGISRFKKLLDIEEVTVNENISKFDLTFFINDEDELFITLEFNTALFSIQTVQKIKHKLHSIILSILSDPDITINALTWSISGNTETEIFNNKVQRIKEDF